MIQTLEKLTKPIVWEKLPKPDNLYQGSCPDGIPAPKNVLLFARTSRRALLEASGRSRQHHRFVLIGNLGTNGSVAIDGKWHRLRESEALLVTPYQVHTYSSIERESMQWIFLTFESEDGGHLENLRGHGIPFGPEIRKCWDELGKEWRRRREASKCLPFLAGFLLEKLKEAAGPRRRKAKPPKGSGVWLPRVHEKVLGSGLVGWRIKDLAQQLGISDARLRAAFRQESGMSLGQYLRKVRINRAAALLAGTSLRVGEIALRCGYDSLYSFSRSFRRAMKVSPRGYRKQGGKSGN